MRENIIMASSRMGDNNHKLSFMCLKTDPSIPAVVFTCFMEELITSCVDSGLVCSRILIPLRSFSKHLNSKLQPCIHV